MFGHKWESARGTVVETRIEQTTVDGMAGLQQVPVYVLDVRRSDGRQQRAEVTGVPGMSTDLAPGTLVAVEVNAKTGEFRFSPDHIKASLAAARNTTAVRIERTGGGVTTVVTSGQPGVRVVTGEQAGELIQGLIGGGDRAAALEKVRQLRAEIQAQPGGAAAQVAGLQSLLGGLAGQAGGLSGQADALHDLAARLQAQADQIGQIGQAGQAGRAGQGSQAGPGGPVGFSSPDAPSTFDAVTPTMPAATFSSPADAFGTPTSSVGPPGGSVSFSSPPVPPPSFESPNPADSFSFGTFGQDSKADRIAALTDQRDRGQLTEQQFQAQRQQILDEI